MGGTGGKQGFSPTESLVLDVVATLETQQQLCIVKIYSKQGFLTSKSLSRKPAQYSCLAHLTTWSTEACDYVAEIQS